MDTIVNIHRSFSQKKKNIHPGCKPPRYRPGLGKPCIKLLRGPCSHGIGYSSCQLAVEASVIRNATRQKKQSSFAYRLDHLDGI